MAKFNKKKSGELPAISTASLPDIVFMLLFFFMVATTMRETTLKIENKLPFADQVEKLDKKDLIMYIYIGKPQEAFQGQYGTESRIQLNDKFAELVDIKSFIASERASKREELVPFLTVALKVDENANMGLVSDVKQELRKENALKINYTTKKGDISENR
ncbi:ExbD/TolR family protein [Gelidibacter pelagius]|uniref:Biopolymer transporter ExbD n=1 Tax=Gelidibacter pelagius TaxID=2819985 RepID=A0ABS3SWK3_9FLAO|nr:biopolymer transporter ExbD [Gelidibacter pelagius]MBO3099278.1 biopolymer transporter ExbD [Gelidibacter pelagius]